MLWRSVVISPVLYSRWWNAVTSLVGWLNHYPSNVAAFMMTSSNGSIFRVTDPLCGEFTGPGEFPTQRPVTRSFDVFFDLRLNKRLSKQPGGWWFETLSWSLWRQCNVQCFQQLTGCLLEILAWGKGSVALSWKDSNDTASQMFGPSAGTS